jgi:hypothetical protein
LLIPSNVPTRCDKNGGSSRSAAIEQGQHLIVRGLGECVVPLPDRAQPIRLERADNLVHLERNEVDRGWRPNRDSADEPVGSKTPNEPQGSSQGRTGGNAIVDYDHSPSGRIEIGTKHFESTIELLQRSGDLGLDIGSIDSHAFDHRIVQERDAVWSHCANGEFSTPRGTDLGGHHAPQFAVKGSRYLGCNDHSPAWDSEYERMCVSKVDEVAGEGASSVDSIAVASHPRSVPPPGGQ